MKLPLQIHFAEVDRSEAVEADIRRRVDKLEALSEKVTACRVHVAHEGRHHHQGRLFKVGVDLTFPGAEIVSSHADEDVFVAIRDAFEAAHRQLKERLRRTQRA